MSSDGSRRSMPWGAGLVAAAALGLVGCGGLEPGPGEAVVEVGTQQSAAVSGTTSVCVTKSNATTVRVDGASILTGSNTDNSTFVVVSSGATQNPGSGGQYAFVENGGFFFDDGSGAHRIFVNSGGRAELNGGGSHRIWVKANGTFTCTSLGGDVTIYYESGAILQNCAGKAQLVPQTPTNSFTRCGATTTTNQVYPQLAFNLTRSGQTLTATNQSTGSYSNPLWTVAASRQTRFSIETQTLYTSSSNSGFTYTLASDFDQTYPSSTWRRTVSLSTTDPFDVSIYASKAF